MSRKYPKRIRPEQGGKNDAKNKGHRDRYPAARGAPRDHHPARFQTPDVVVEQIRKLGYEPPDGLALALLADRNADAMNVPDRRWPTLAGAYAGEVPAWVTVGRREGP